MKIQLQKILDLVKPDRVVGNDHVVVESIVSMGDFQTNRNSLYWCSDKNREALLQVKTGVIIVSVESLNFVVEKNAQRESDVTWLAVEKPRLAFMKVLKMIQESTVREGVVSASARIDKTAVFDRQTIFVGENVVIEHDVKIGSHVFIDHNSIIKSGTILGDHVKIGANCTIGGVGFGYEPNEDGNYELMPHIGNVVISNAVEIGNNTCIDRAVLGSTFIDEHVKIDNLVHIAHGVQIGKNSLVIANAMIAGSVRIGENCWIAPSVSVIQKTSVGNNAVVGLGSVVIRDVEARTIVAGVPAKKIKDNV